MKYVILAAILSSGTLKCQLLNTKFRISHGTTVMAVINSDSAVLGADTKGDYSRSLGQKGKIIKIRKIYKTENIIYAFVELKALYEYDKEIYDAEKIMSRIIKREKDLVKSFNAFNDSIIGKLNIAKDSLELDNQLKFLELYTRKSILSFVMIGIKKDKLIYRVGSYRFMRDSIGKLKTIVDPTPKRPNSPQQIIALGQRDEIVKRLNDNPSYFWGASNVKEKIVCLIKLEADKNPDIVGLPVDIMVMRKNGVKWFYNNKKCIIGE